MTAEPSLITVDPAARRPLGNIAAGAERFTEARVERILAVVVALGCAVLGAQAFLNALGSTQESPGWRIVLMLGAFVPLAVMIAALVVGRFARIASGVCAEAIAVVIACWPLATAGHVADPDVAPWIWYLINVAPAAAVVAFRMPLQLVWAVVVPVLYGVVRLVQVGVANPQVVTGVVLDVVFGMILAGVIVALGWVLRSLAVGVDRARADAVGSYAAAASAAAAETERVAVAALMHDSVLAALIAAERATTPREEALAVAMAREALTRLANAELDAGEGSDEPRPAASIVEGIERAGAELGIRVPIDAHLDPAANRVPGRVVRALVLAATQAISNAVQHADGVGLEVEVRADAGLIAVRVTDSGGGFVPKAVPSDRLGIRGSIVARMAAAGGRARVQTSAAGTTVLLEWEQPR
ncbi:MAG: ATP-binding protein [Microbacterium sp.]|nr:MAG: ATP-binding protein [Microbacterium sp.]